MTFSIFDMFEFEPFEVDFWMEWGIDISPLNSVVANS